MKAAWWIMAMVVTVVLFGNSYAQETVPNMDDLYGDDVEQTLLDLAEVNFNEPDQNTMAPETLYDDGFGVVPPEHDEFYSPSVNPVFSDETGNDELESTLMKTSIPEPSGLLLLGSALVGIRGFMKRRRM